MRAPENHLVPPALTVFAGRHNILQRLLEVMEDNVLPADALSATRSSPVCTQGVEVVDDTGGKVIRSTQDGTEPTKTVMSDIKVAEK